MSQSANAVYSGDTLYIRDNWSSERIEHMLVVALTVLRIKEVEQVSAQYPELETFKKCLSLLMGNGTVFQSVIIRLVMD